MELTEWAVLKQRVDGCTKCDISRMCTKKVFGAGNGQAKIMLVGEAPGEKEDETGVPFVGDAGKVLRKVLEKAKYEADMVYVTNVIKCRPPENRDPVKSEIANCSTYLLKQVEHVNPRVIVAIGLVAAVAITGKKATVGAMRGKMLNGLGRTVVVTWHPAHWIRTRDKMVWDQMVRDLKRAREIVYGAAEESREEE